MKITYSDEKKEINEPIAYIDKDGHLVCKINGNYDEFLVIYADSNSIEITEYVDYLPFNSDNKQVFYKGDSITITF